MKEEDTTLHSVLNNVFTPLTKKRVKELGLTDEEETRYVARLAREIDGSGRDSAVAVGAPQTESSRFSKLTISQVVLDTMLHFVDTTRILRSKNEQWNGLPPLTTSPQPCTQMAISLRTSTFLIPSSPFTLYFKTGAGDVLNEIKRTGM